MIWIPRIVGVLTALYGVSAILMPGVIGTLLPSPAARRKIAAVAGVWAALADASALCAT